MNGAAMGMNIFEKISAITAELGVVAKNLEVETGKNKSYRAVSERDIIDAVKPLESKYGVYSYPSRRTVLESNLLESESTYNGNTTKKTTLMTRIETVYRFVNIEKPDEYIETTTFAEGMDSQDKGAGKAMTYADKYALMKVYKISTGDDPDQIASEDVSYRPVDNSKPMTAREILIKELRDRGIDVSEFAKKHGVVKGLPDSEYLNLIWEVRAGNI
jgi:hypothetical protein